MKKIVYGYYVRFSGCVRYGHSLISTYVSICQQTNDQRPVVSQIEATRYVLVFGDGQHLNKSSMTRTILEYTTYTCWTGCSGRSNLEMNDVSSDIWS